MYRCIICILPASGLNALISVVLTVKNFLVTRTRTKIKTKKYALMVGNFAHTPRRQTKRRHEDKGSSSLFFTRTGAGLRVSLSFVCVVC